MNLKQSGLLCILAVTVLVSGCASVMSKPVKPTIELVSVKPLNINLSEQRLRFALKITNPNAFDLPIEAVDFVARFNGADVANGKSNQAVTVPANDAAIMSLDVTAGLERLTDTLSTLLQGKALNLDYELTGAVKVDNWPKPIPFDVTGAMDVTDSGQ